MREKYTIVSNIEATEVQHCPYSVENQCMGDDCMAWIQEIDDDGNLTKYGRCGMVASPLYSTQPVDEPKKKKSTRQKKKTESEK